METTKGRIKNNTKTRKESKLALGEIGCDIPLIFFQFILYICRTELHKWQQTSTLNEQSFSFYTSLSSFLSKCLGIVCGNSNHFSTTIQKYCSFHVTSLIMTTIFLNIAQQPYTERGGAHTNTISQVLPSSKSHAISGLNSKPSRRLKLAKSAISTH